MSDEAIPEATVPKAFVPRASMSFATVERNDLFQGGRPWHDRSIPLPFVKHDCAIPSLLVP